MINEILQIIVIILHSIIIYYNYREKRENTIKETFGTLTQFILICLFIYELGCEDLHFKKWYWFMFDFILVFYFILRLKTYNNVNKIKETKCFIGRNEKP